MCVRSLSHDTSDFSIMSGMYVVMTPFNFDSMKTIRFERTSQIDQSRVHHVAGGQHAGIIVNQECKIDSIPSEVPEMQLEFTCVMYNNRTTETHAVSVLLKTTKNPLELTFLCIHPFLMIIVSQTRVHYI